VEDVEEDRLLALVIMIERRLRRLAGRRQPAERGGGEALGRKQAGGLFQDRRPLVVVILGAETGHRADQSRGRLSITRRALPIERSTPPGASTRIAAETPISSLTRAPRWAPWAARASSAAWVSRASTTTVMASRRSSRV